MTLYQSIFYASFRKGPCSVTVRVTLVLYVESIVIPCKRYVAVQHKSKNYTSIELGYSSRDRVTMHRGE